MNKPRENRRGRTELSGGAPRAFSAKEPEKEPLWEIFSSGIQI
jgi:hypothetical protein